MTNPTEKFAAIGAAAAPAFSADGQTVYHLRGAGMPSLWAMPVAGGEGQPLAEPNEKVAFLRRAPKDDRLIYGIDAGGDECQQLWLIDAEGPRALTAAPAANHDFGAWSPDGTAIAYAANDRDVAHFDAIVHTLGGEARRVYQGTHQLSVTAWHPDGSRLLLLAEDATGDGALLVLTLADGSVRPIPHIRPAESKSVRWAKDGSHLQGLTDGGGEFMALCRIDPETGGITSWFSVHGADVEAWSLSPDGMQLATVENDRGFAVLRVGPVAAVERPVVQGLPHGVVADLAWAPDSAVLAMSASGPTQPAGLYLYTVATQEVTPLWQPEAPPGLRPFGLVQWPTFDGRHIPGWLAHPPGEPPAGGWPSVMWVHGGPAGQTRANFRADMQMLLARGYAVLMPNVRGSTGYGRASTASDDVALRLDSVHDLAAAHTWLAAQPGIDPARIGIMGQSYGGYMVLAAITEYPALWKTAVDYYGIADFTTLLRDTGPWRRSHRSREYGDPQRDAALFARISPIKNADAIRCPLLVLHGTRDPPRPLWRERADRREPGHEATPGAVRNLRLCRPRLHPPGRQAADLRGGGGVLWADVVGSTARRSRCDHARRGRRPITGLGDARGIELPDRQTDGVRAEDPGLTFARSLTARPMRESRAQSGHRRGHLIDSDQPVHRSQQLQSERRLESVDHGLHVLDGSTVGFGFGRGEEGLDVRLHGVIGPNHVERTGIGQPLLAVEVASVEAIHHMTERVRIGAIGMGRELETQRIR